MTPSQPIDAQACQISKTTMCSDPHKNVNFSKDRRVVLEPNLDSKSSAQAGLLFAVLLRSIKPP
jgi:hypothetical protein